MASSLTVTAGWVICGIWLTFKIFSYVETTRKLKTIPFTHILTSPNDAIGNLNPPSWSRIGRGGMYPFAVKRRDYEQAGWNVIASISLLPKIDSVIWVADAGAIKQIVNDRIFFPKPLERYKVIEVFGTNVISTEGEDWKRHRRVSQPAFSERNSKLVWNSATNTMTHLFEDVWGGKPEIYVKNLREVTIRVTLIVLSIAGFGKDMQWNHDSETSTTKTLADPLTTTRDDKMNKNESYKHTMTFTESLSFFSKHILINITVPRCLKFITKKMREARRAEKELDAYLDELIDARIEERASTDETSHGDLLSNLVEANLQEEEATSPKTGARSHLVRSELKGNVFVYLIAGHESTAHTLTYMIGLLALYPGEQGKLYNHILETVGSRDTTFNDFPKFTRVIASFYETLRMFPPANMLAKRCLRSTVFSASAVNPNSRETRAMAIPSGSIVFVHIAGLHYNERYWPDPYTFKPDRFLGDWNKDAFMSFNGGARACIGRRFAEVEAVAIIVVLLRNYSIHLSPEKEMEYAGLSVHEKTDRLLKSDNLLTLT